MTEFREEPGCIGFIVEVTAYSPPHFFDRGSWTDMNNTT